MLTSRINFINFKSKSKSKSKTISVKKKLNLLFKEKNEIIKSLSTDYKNAFSKKTLHKYKKSSNFRVIGMGGSSLGTKAIYDFLKTKINKKFTFIDNLQPSYNVDKKKKFSPI